MSERAPGDELSIAIISNAGVSGAAGSVAALTTALACNYSGFKDISVYHDTSHVIADHSVELSPNASRVIRSLKILDDLEADCFEPQFIHQRSYRTGFQLAITALGAMAEGRYYAPFWHVQCSTLTNALAAAATARGIQLHSNASVTALRQNDVTSNSTQTSQNAVVELGLTLGSANSGQTERRVHDVALVADDPQQQARMLSNAEPLMTTATSLTHWRGSTPFENLPLGAFAAVITQWLGPHHHLSYHFTAGGELLEFSAIVDNPNQATPSSKQDLLAAFAGWHPSITALLESATHLESTPVISTTPVERLAHGNIAFLGASCHAIAPHLPQQHALGIEDAWVISRMLEQWEDEPASGLVEFERYRLPRARRLHTQANLRANQLCDTRAFETWRRNLAMTFGSRFLPELAMQKNDWLYGYDAVNGFE